MPTFRELCTPSKFYFSMSIFFLLMAAIQNMGFSTEYHLGHYHCGVSSTLLIFALKLMYVLFWTWILNQLCSAGYIRVSWFLVLFPYLLTFIAVTVGIWMFLKMHILSQK